MEPQYVAGGDSCKRAHDADTPQIRRCSRSIQPRLYVLRKSRDSLSQGRVRVDLIQDQFRLGVLSGGSEQRLYRRQQCLNPSKRLSHSASLPSFLHVAVLPLKKKLLSLSQSNLSQCLTSTKKFAGQALQISSPASHTFQAVRGVMP